MVSTVKDIEVPVVLSGHTIGTATFTVEAKEIPNGVIAIISYGQRFIGDIQFNAGTSFETVMATIQERLTP